MKTVGTIFLALFLFKLAGVVEGYWRARQFGKCVAEENELHARITDPKTLDRQLAGLPSWPRARLIQSLHGEHAMRLARCKAQSNERFFLLH